MHTHVHAHTPFLRFVGQVLVMQLSAPLWREAGFRGSPLFWRLLCSVPAPSRSPSLAFLLPFAL